MVEASLLLEISVVGGFVVVGVSLLLEILVVGRFVVVGALSLLEISVVGGFVVVGASLLLEISVVGGFVVGSASLLLESVVGVAVVKKLQEGSMCVVVNGSGKVNLLKELLSLFSIADEELRSELEELGFALTLQWHLLPPVRTVNPNFIMYLGFLLKSLRK